MNKDTYCVIMAGGVGSRFWPLSTSNTPKQFLDILGTGKTLLQQTYERFQTLCCPENFIIVTMDDYRDIVKTQLPNIDPSQILTEPTRKNTAPCIAYANKIVKNKNKNAIIIVTPADHLIINEIQFVKNIQDGVKYVEGSDKLLTFGIKPSRPETGYGYIQIEEENPELNHFSKAKTFTEKPNEEIAKAFYESGEFFWNSGMFIWTIDAIEKAFNDHLPHVSTIFNTFSESIGTEDENQKLQNTYSQCKKISIDYGIMEKAKNVYVLTVDFGWSDLGTWGSLYDNSEKDQSNNTCIKGHVKLYDTHNSIVSIPPNKTAVIQGLNDYIVVQSNDALLICPKENEQQIRKFKTDLKTNDGIDI